MTSSYNRELSIQVRLWPGAAAAGKKRRCRCRCDCGSKVAEIKQDRRARREEDPRRMALGIVQQSWELGGCCSVEVLRASTISFLLRGVTVIIVCQSEPGLDLRLAAHVLPLTIWHAGAFFRHITRPVRSFFASYVRLEPRHQPRLKMWLRVCLN